MISFFRAHKRAITILLVVLGAFWLSPRFDIEFLLFVLLIASQLFWIRRALDVGDRIIPGKSRRTWLAVVARLSTCSSVCTVSPTSESCTNGTCLRRVVFQFTPIQGCAAF